MAGNDAAPAPPAVAAELFGDRLALAEVLAERLVTVGLERGLLGPREAPRIWSRHLVNCAVIGDLLPVVGRVVDVGSGAGLPGLVLAIRRPGLHVELVESMQRRCDFLVETVEQLGLESQVRVRRGRIEELATGADFVRSEWVTARAVAPLERLARWCRGALTGSGTLVALKGQSADDEAERSRPALRRLGFGTVSSVSVGSDSERTWAIVARQGKHESRVGQGDGRVRGAGERS